MNNDVRITSTSENMLQIVQRVNQQESANERWCKSQTTDLAGEPHCLNIRMVVLNQQDNGIVANEAVRRVERRVLVIIVSA